MESPQVYNNAVDFNSKMAVHICYSLIQELNLNRSLFHFYHWLIGSFNFIFIIIINFIGFDW